MDQAAATEPTRRSPRLATATGVMAVLAANAWVGQRLEPLLQDTVLGEVVVLDRKIEAFPTARVQVLVVGNSHAMAGLRPPLLAAAWGLPPEAVFSLALPGSSPREMALLLARHRARFPNLKLVLAGVDSYFLGTHHAQRLRYLTAGRPAERVAATAFWQPKDRLAAMAGVMLPVLDFGPALHASFAEHPLHTLRALVKPVPMLNPTWLGLIASPYRWGYPPPWDEKTERERRHERLLTRSPVAWRGRASAFMSAEAPARAGAADLAALADGPAGVRLALVETPFAPAFMAEHERLSPGFRAWWLGLLAQALAGRDVPLLEAPPAALADFYDVDHLTPAGATKLAAQVARRLAPDGTRPRS